ncbi:hypothetical protein A7T52_19325 [Salmonella enterica subsp. diarizonae serovar 60:r:e,n,x,z15]|nr:hypothetical protein A7T52_19325 [Salmonella enterica subsp. diarizonae serovar 60:r:e,n,x,z15]
MVLLSQKIEINLLTVNNLPDLLNIHDLNASPVAGLEAEKLAIKGAPGMYLRMPIVGLITAREIFTSKQLSVRKIMWPPGQECLALHRVLMTNTSIFIAAHLVECQIRSLGDFVN